MRLATRITLGSILLVLLLAAVLAYQGWLVRRLVSAHRDLSSIKLSAALTTTEMLGLLDEIEKATDKFFITRDPVYRDKAQQLGRVFTDQLRDLEALARSLSATQPRDSPEGAWARRILDLSPHHAAEMIGKKQEDLALELEKPELEQLLTLLEEEDQLELFDLVAQLEDLEERERQQQSDQLGLLRERVSELLELTRETINRQVDRSVAAGQQAESVSWGVVLAAITITMLVTLFTTRSINEPLKRLIEGTRAVAEGRFTYQLTEVRGDELAGLARSFNTMVRRLDELDQMKKDFLAHVSHDLKTPLAAMHETNRLLLDQIPGPLNERQQRLVSLNLESGQRLSTMISKLLDLARMEAGGLDLDLKPQDLVELARFVAEEFGARLNEALVPLKTTWPTGPTAVCCDRDRIIQVVENLFENALNVSPAAANLSLRVAWLEELPRSLPPVWRRKLATYQTAGWGLLSLADQGPGVAEADKETIFQKFHQLNGSPSRSLGGVGLGLAISREIVEAHDGAIWVADNAPRGSTFHLLLPSVAKPGLVADPGAPA